MKDPGLKYNGKSQFVAITCEVGIGLVRKGNRGIVHGSDHVSGERKDSIDVCGMFRIAIIKGIGFGTSHSFRGNEVGPGA
jgi:hypothetical protein